MGFMGIEVTLNQTSMVVTYVLFVTWEVHFFPTKKTPSQIEMEVPDKTGLLVTPNSYDPPGFGASIFIFTVFGVGPASALDSQKHRHVRIISAQYLLGHLGQTLEVLDTPEN